MLCPDFYFRGFGLWTSEARVMACSLQSVQRHWCEQLRKMCQGDRICKAAWRMRGLHSKWGLVWISESNIGTGIWEAESKAGFRVQQAQWSLSLISDLSPIMSCLDGQALNIPLEFPNRSLSVFVLGCGMKSRKELIYSGASTSPTAHRLLTRGQEQI